ncbi:hypothetical protein R3P38DRAFT_3337119 [Favolaschia claudopus]|uniref:DUF6589 domain-containing protein n=1 Tax=Favolaschia claudopus TaxID=2862362 RepID=A0AAV9Z2S3_9AGAR
MGNESYIETEGELRIGRENRMVIGIACTFFEIFVDLEALDVLDKRRRIASSRRTELTVESLLGMIDQINLRRVGTLQFLEALSNYVPEAAIYKPEIDLRYRTTAQKLQVPLVKHEISPLASSGKNEALEQTGQTEDDFDSRLLFVGGDGMSYNNLNLVKKYLQNHHPHSFRSFEIVRPTLAIWHTLWTDLCRIFETHWGAPLNDNVASLGHSAKKIGRATPGNLKKVDFYPSAQLLTLVHDVRMLDCWSLKSLKTLPTFDELELGAERLFDTYVGSAGRYQAGMDALESNSAWAPHAPLGTQWTSVPDPPPQPPKAKRKSKKILVPKIFKKPSKPKPPPPPPPPFFGDQALFDSGTFMYDATVFREAVAATAQGDVGRVWEALKSMVFTFAGSTHSKYMGYLLEMICDLELESNSYLKDASLFSMVLNPDGGHGQFKPCDIYQEFLNKCLDPIVQRKDADYGAFHIRNIYSRNIKDIHDLKTEFRKGLDLTKRTSKHKKPHEKPEVKILLKTYRDNELHKRRPGRTYKDGRDVNDFERGMQHLAKGALTNPNEDSDHDSDWSDDDDSETEESPMTMGDAVYREGELTIDLADDDDDMFPAALCQTVDSDEDDE